MATPSVLIVEDQEHSRELLAGVIAAAGYRVTEAGDGEHALALLRGGLRPNLVLLDLHLPGMDGWQLHAAMHDDPALARIPVVVMSAAAAHTPPPLGIVDTLPKPLDLRALFLVLERYCGEADAA